MGNRCRKTPTLVPDSSKSVRSDIPWMVFRYRLFLFVLDVQQLSHCMQDPISLSKEEDPEGSRWGGSVCCVCLLNSKCKGKKSGDYAEVLVENWGEYADKLSTCYTVSPARKAVCCQSTFARYDTEWPCCLSYAVLIIF